MTKAELIASMAEKADLSKNSAGKALEAFLSSVEETLVKDGKLTITGFGTFKVSERKARVGRNPQTGVEIKIPATKVVQFSCGKALKNAVK